MSLWKTPRAIAGVPIGNDAEGITGNYTYDNEGNNAEEDGESLTYTDKRRCLYDNDAPQP